MTLRSVILGTLLASFTNLWTIYSSYVLDATRADYGHLSVAAMVPFVLFLAANILLRRLWPEKAMTSAELLVILSMGMVAAMMQGEWLAGYFIGTITASHYFASPENQWSSLLLDHTPDWLIVSDQGRAVRWFYDGSCDLLCLGQRAPGYFFAEYYEKYSARKIGFWRTCHDG